MVSFKKRFSVSTQTVDQTYNTWRYRWSQIRHSKLTFINLERLALILDAANR